MFVHNFTMYPIGMLLGSQEKSEGDFQKGLIWLQCIGTMNGSICGFVLRFPLFSQNPTMAIQ